MDCACVGCTVHCTVIHVLYSVPYNNVSPPSTLFLGGISDNCCDNVQAFFSFLITTVHPYSTTLIVPQSPGFQELFFPQESFSWHPINHLPSYPHWLTINNIVNLDSGNSKFTVLKCWTFSVVNSWVLHGHFLCVIKFGHFCHLS